MHAIKEVTYGSTKSAEGAHSFGNTEQCVMLSDTSHIYNVLTLLYISKDNVKIGLSLSSQCFMSACVPCAQAVHAVSPPLKCNAESKKEDENRNSNPSSLSARGVRRKITEFSVYATVLWNVSMACLLRLTMDLSFHTFCLCFWCQGAVISFLSWLNMLQP